MVTAQKKRRRVLYAREALRTEKRVERAGNRATFLEFCAANPTPKPPKGKRLRTRNLLQIGEWGTTIGLLNPQLAAKFTLEELNGIEVRVKETMADRLERRQGSGCFSPSNYPIEIEE